MAKIARDNAKCVLSREERRDDFPKSSFRLTIYRTDKDGNDRYVQPTRMVNLETHLGIASSPFEYLTHVRQVHFNAVLIFVGL